MIFDCDGTIINSMPMLTQLAVDTITTYYKISIEDARLSYQRTIGIPFREQLEQIFPKNSINGATAIIYETEHLKLSSTFPLSPNVKDLFIDLRSKGYLLALVTSTDWTILRDNLPQVRSLGFDFLSGYMLNRDKMTQMGTAMRILKTDRRNTVYVGDTDFDYECAEFHRVPFVRTKSATLRDDVLFALESLPELEYYLHE